MEAVLKEEEEQRAVAVSDKSSNNQVEWNSGHNYPTNGNNFSS